MQSTVKLIILISIIFLFSHLCFGHENLINTVYVKAPVSIGNIGIQNLVVGISYDSVSTDDEFLQTAEYISFLNGVKIEIQRIAMNEILAHPYLTLDTMSELTITMQSKIKDLIESLLQDHYPDRQLAIPVSISRVEFYSTDRSTLSIQRNDF